jgi:DNA-binding GntR family transcriptional regulator
VLPAIGVASRRVAGSQPALGTPPPSITPPSIPELICSELRRWIAAGELKPGPLKIAEVARHFGVSSVPVREALRTLEAEGFLRFDRNRSVQVIGLSVEGLHEIYEIRLFLEPALGRQAAPLIQADDQRLDRLDALAQQMRLQDVQLAAWAKANTAFHWQIYEASPMVRMKSIVFSLLTAVEPFVRLCAATEELQSAQDDHLQLLQHVRKGDSEAVADLIRQHLQATLRLVESKLH